MRTLLTTMILLTVACRSGDRCPDPDLHAKHRNYACIMVHDPVCGCDGKTYGNNCEARREGVRVVRKGEC